MSPQTPTIAFRKTTPRSWRETARYRVLVDGHDVGSVARTQNSSRTGGFWNARLFTGVRVVVSTGFETRAAAAAALVEMAR